MPEIKELKQHILEKEEEISLINEKIDHKKRVAN